jgi:hypothetical protein
VETIYFLLDSWKKILKYIKLAKLVVLQVIGFVEGDHCFLLLSFMKTKVWHQSTKVHLEFIIHIFSHKFFKVELSFWNNNSKLEGH